MKKIFVGLSLVLALGLSACTTVLPVTVNGPIGSKTGTSNGGVVLGLIYYGDASIVTAAKNGDIKEVTTVDQKITSILGGLFIGHETIVTGE